MSPHGPATKLPRWRPPRSRKRETKGPGRGCCSPSAPLWNLRSKSASLASYSLFSLHALLSVPLPFAPRGYHVLAAPITLSSASEGSGPLGEGSRNLKSGTLPCLARPHCSSPPSSVRDAGRRSPKRPYTSRSVGILERQASLYMACLTNHAENKVRPQGSLCSRAQRLRICPQHGLWCPPVFRANLLSL